MRLFRFDRIVAARVSTNRRAPPQRALDADDTSLFDGDPSLPAARLWIAPTFTWMFDYYPFSDVRVLPDGSCEAVHDVRVAGVDGAAGAGLRRRGRCARSATVARGGAGAGGAALDAYDAYDALGGDTADGG